MKYLLRVIAIILFFHLYAMPVLSQETEQELTQENQDSEPLQDDSAEIDLDEMRRRILKEDPQEFLSYSLGDSNVSLFMAGSWMGGITLNPGFFISPLGFGFSSPESPFLFKQEADITLSLWINDKWFIEANFLDAQSGAAGDNFINTYRAGYEGFPGEFFQYAGIGNTGLDFPSFPYLDLGGDSHSSFGFYSRFGPEKITFHALVRYDTAAREERIFLGGRERTYLDVSPVNFLRGISFVLPDENITSDIIVYIEDEESGGIIDNNGRRWRHALPSEYAAGRTQGLLEMSIRTAAMISVSYSKNGSNRPWDASMGNYSSGGYLAGVQNWFGADINLENFTQCGNGSGYGARPGEVLLNSVPALIIYEPGAFSPFERLNGYASPSDTSETAALVTQSSGIEIKGFRLIERYDALLNLIPSQLNSANTAASQNRAVYELLTEESGAAFSRRSPQNIWPLAVDYPEIYLPPSGVFTGDISLRFTNYNSTRGFYIGADVISGSVQVWRSGIQDSGFSYNSSTGEVTLRGSVPENELIRITYLRKGMASQSGSIAAGFGAVYKKNSFSAQAAAGVRWNITSDSFSQSGHSNMGIIGVSAKAAWNYGNFNAHAAGAFTYAQTDTTGLYRVTGMEGNETILTMPPESSFISNPPASNLETNLNAADRADLIYRNYYNSNFLGSSLMPVEWNAPVVSGFNKPYPAKDSRLNVQVLIAEFNLDSAKKWTGFQVPLVFGPEIFSRAGEIEVPFRLYSFDNASLSNLKIIIQIGSLSGMDITLNENIELIWEGSIYPDLNNENISSDGEYWIARFILNDEDRRKLADAKHLRLIAVNTGVDSSAQVTGRIALIPPIIRGASFRAVTWDGNTISANSGNAAAVEVKEGLVNNLESSGYGSVISRLHPEKNTQRVLRAVWDNLNETGVGAGIDGRFQVVPLSDYRELSFFFKIEDIELQAQDGELNFIIASGPESISDPVLTAKIPMNVFDKEKWSKVTIRYQGSNTGVFIDGNYINDGFTYIRQTSFNETGRTSYIAVLITPFLSSQYLGNGTVYIDEIILEDAVMLYRMNAGAALEYSKQGAIISLNGVSMLSDFSFFSRLESEARIENESVNAQIQGGMTGSAAAAISFFGTRIAGNISFNAAQDSFIWDADHSITGKYGLFSFKETFFISPETHISRHNINLSFDWDIHAGFSAGALTDNLRLRRNWAFNIGYRSLNEYIPVIAFKSDAAYLYNRTDNESGNYFLAWLETWEDLVPEKGVGALSRKLSSQISLTQRTKPVGAALTIDGAVNYTGINNVLHLDNAVFLNIPVILNKLHLNFRAGRSFSRHLNYQSDDIFNDSNKFFESLNDCLPFWAVIPFYSLFAAELGGAMDKSINDSHSSDLIFNTVFKDHFSAILNLPSSYNLTSLFIPSSVTFRIERSLEQKMDTRSDILNLGGSFGYSAINMFGAMGYAPLFKFYQTDEYSHVIDAGVIIPNEGRITWRAQSMLRAGFRGFSGGVLNFKNLFNIKTNNDWSESFNIEWEAPTKNSLTSKIFDLIASAIEKQGSWLTFSSIINSGYQQMRRESFELTFDKSNGYLRWSAAAGHEEIVRIIGRLNFTAFIKAAINQNAQTSALTFDLKLGTTFRIIF